VPREIIVDWSVEDGGGGLSVLYYDTAATAASQRLALNSFLGSVDAICASSTSWTIRQEGRELADATGTLTGVWSNPVAYSGTGGGSAFTVANTSQLLVRWLTNDIVSGRFVRGRTNIPGVDQQYIDGDWTTGVVSTVQTAINTLIATTAGPGVWHRPVGGAGGSFHEVVSGSVWQEAAVLRRRRS
jgi:hypothetical protein